MIEQSGEYSFDALQMRLHPAESRIRKPALETPAKLVLFDMLADTNGIVLIDRPLSARRAALEAFVKSSNVKDIKLSPATFDEKKPKRG